MRKLIPQYLREQSKAAHDSSITNQPTTLRRSLEGPSNPPPLAESDDGLPLKEGTINRAQLSGDFTLRIPQLQETKDNHADRPLPLLTPKAAVETQRFDPRASFPLQTPTQRLSRRSSSFVLGGKTTHNLDQSSVSRQSDRHNKPPERLLLQDNRVSKAHPPLIPFEGSSPVLHVTANRSISQPLANPQREFCAQGGSLNNIILSETSKNHFPRPSAGFDGGDGNHAAVADPFATGETAPPLQPSRPIRRDGSTKSLKDVQRRRDGESPLFIQGRLRP